MRPTAKMYLQSSEKLSSMNLSPLVMLYLLDKYYNFTYPFPAVVCISLSVCVRLSFLSVIYQYSCRYAVMVSLVRYSKPTPFLVG